MAEVWYLEMDTVTLDGKEARYILEFKECIRLLELSPERWKCEPEKIPNLRTGNPLIDESGYVGVVIRVTQDEIDALEDKRWKPGWYLSPLTLIGAEKKLKKR
jgi:hypothetical protein